LDVILVEQDSLLGGSSLAFSGTDHTIPEASCLSSKGVRVMTRTTAFGLYDNAVAGLIERVTDHLESPPEYFPRQRFWTVRSRYIVLATGAIERHIAFGNNDRPGIMTVSAGRTYLNRFGILPGEKIIVATNNDSAYEISAELKIAGASVTLLDARTEVSDGVSEQLEDHGVELRLGYAPLEAKGTKAIRSLVTASVTGEHWREDVTEQCDLVLVSGGWSPVVNLLSHRGVRPKWNAENACFMPDSTDEPMIVAGAAAGVWNAERCVASGEKAGQRAVQFLSGSSETIDFPEAGGWISPIRPLYEVTVPTRKVKSFVDFQHDVTTEDVRLAHREGYVSVEHLKRYTTLGMATDGGKMGNVIGLALMAEALGKEIPEVGTTTFRPPYTPISIGALSGPSIGTHFRPLRRTSLHSWNIDHGAKMMEVGLWQRPWHYPEKDEAPAEAYVREASITRTAVGLCDVTSLGKIAIQGPDATEFLNRVYTNAFAKLPIGKARYGIMLRDDGLVMDDGTAWRLSETDYFITTTTAHAAKVMSWLEELLQTRWFNLKVHVASVSEQWTGIAVAGPYSRKVLEKNVREASQVSNEQLPFMGVIEANVAGCVPCRIARISFSGELAYEVYVPADFGPDVMDRLWSSAKEMGGCLYGLEALGTMRIEKGHVTGAELDGRVTLEDAGLGRMASTKKSFIGNALRQRPELLREDRPQLVGIFPKDRSLTFNAGSILCSADQTNGHGAGWITAITHSPELGHWIGIGFISGGYSAWEGKRVISADPVRDGNVEVEIVSPHMVDPEGERMYG
jgi:sarcosine oxidase subunit alpha